MAERFPPMPGMAVVAMTAVLAGCPEPEAPQIPPVSTDTATMPTDTGDTYLPPQPYPDSGHSAVGDTWVPGHSEDTGPTGDTDDTYLPPQPFPDTDDTGESATQATGDTYVPSHTGDTYLPPQPYPDTGHSAVGDTSVPGHTGDTFLPPQPPPDSGL